MRQILLVLHRYLALATALFLALVAASGCLLTFEGAIDRALNPALLSVESASAPALPLDTLAARVRAALPDSQIVRVTLPLAADQAVEFTAGRGLQVFVDPYTGAVQGTRTAEERERSFARRVHDFHETLLLERYGHTIVGAVTAIAFLLVVSGIPLWWKRRIVSVGRGSWKRVVFDLHHSAGLFASLALGAITFSGIWMQYEWMTNAIRSAGGGVTPAIPKQPPASNDRAPVSFGSALRVAERALPGARVRFLASPPDADQPMTVALRFPEDRTPGGRSRVFVDKYAGTALGVWSTRSGALGNRLDSVKRSIHTGDVFGKPSQAVWLLASLVMVVQAVTGVLMWWNGRKGRRASAQRTVNVARRVA